jgi:hypothetical protein
MTIFLQKKKKMKFSFFFKYQQKEGQKKYIIASDTFFIFYFVFFLNKKCKSWAKVDKKIGSLSSLIYIYIYIYIYYILRKGFIDILVVLDHVIVQSNLKERMQCPQYRPFLCDSSLVDGYV